VAFCGHVKILLAFLLILPAFSQQSITRIACGSCYKPERDNGIWRVIAAEQPQAFLFMGDNIYADTDDPKVMKEKYQRLVTLPDYATFSKTVPILPIWDDHDYGKNDAGREFPMKEASARLFFDAFNFPADHEARKTPGVYHSKILGPVGQRVQIIMLDTRTFRSELPKKKINRRSTYLPQTGPDTTMLGKAQWNWLEAQLKKTAELRLIVSSIQVLATSHRFEKWGNLPDERARLFQLLAKSGNVPTVLLSGDRHLAEVCRLPKTQSKLAFDLHEMTASGMTHAGAPDDPDPLRIKGTYTRQTNFGLIKIAWQKSKPTVTLEIKSSAGDLLSATKVNF
jgi:alkaline phosphatase D